MCLRCAYLQTYMAHCIHSADEELDLMLERNTGVCHCPTSNIGSVAILIMMSGMIIVIKLE